VMMKIGWNTQRELEADFWGKRLFFGGGLFSWQRLIRFDRDNKCGSFI
jgi:hypothetical protein